MPFPTVSISPLLSLLVCAYGEYAIGARACTGRRAIQFSIFPSPPWAFDSFPPWRGKGGMGGEKHGLGTPPAFTPTLALPRRGGGKRLTGRVGSGQYLGRAWDPTGAWHENC